MYNTSINLFRKENIECIEYNDLFKVLIEKCCNNCHRKYQTKYNEYNFTENNYLILYISNIYNGNLLSTNIINFDPDFVLIPGNNTMFFVKSAICYIPELKHYVIFVRKNEYWLNISDSTMHTENLFVKFLKNVYIILLEKKQFEEIL